MKLALDFSFTTGILINAVILYLLFKRKNEGVNKKILFVVFAFLFLTIICFYGFLHKNAFLFYSTFIFEDSLTVLIGPLLLIYVKSVFLPTSKILLRNLVHFLFPIFYIVTVSFPVFLSMWFDADVLEYITIWKGYFSLAIVYSLVYCFITLNVLKKAKGLIKSSYSNLQTVDVSWILVLLVGTIVVICIDVSTTCYELIFGELTWNTFYLTAVGVVFLIGYLGYHGLMQSKILVPSFLIENRNVFVERNPIIHKSESISYYNEVEIIQLNNVLDEVMKERRPYLNEDLSLSSLAELLPTTDKKLSYLLNQYKKISFYDFINQHRVQSVKMKMSDPFYDRYTLLAIAFECGFKSKSSFNRIFKKVTSYSPSEYKTELKLAKK